MSAGRQRPGGRPTRGGGRFDGISTGRRGPALLHTPLDPELAILNADERKFKAPRSLRDVEPSVNLILKRLDGTEIEPLSPDGEA